jgi:hypothetical protein
LAEQNKSQNTLEAQEEALNLYKQALSPYINAEIHYSNYLKKEDKQIDLSKDSKDALSRL